MTARWQTVRVFISSTFSDMHSERDHLVKVVFPALRERLVKYRVHLVDVDLRWGVTKEQADDDRALDLCLQQIDDCRPFFIGILGERYGWVLQKIPNLEKPEYGWVQGMTGKSITDLETVHGVLTHHEMQSRSFFYFRNASFLDDVPAAKRGDMLSDSEESAGKLRELKQSIRNAGVTIYEDYPCRYCGQKINWRLAEQKLKGEDRQRLQQAAGNGIVDADGYANLDKNLRKFLDDESVVYLDGLNMFGQAGHDQLWEAIHAQLNLPEEGAAPASVERLAKLSPASARANDFPQRMALAEETGYHDRFMESRLRVYVGREPIQRALEKFADSDSTVPCLVTGPSGLGKSAAMAKFVASYKQKHMTVLVVRHFIGASPPSTGLRTMLHRFCSILRNGFGFTHTVEREGWEPEDVPVEIPPDTASLSSLFRQFIDQVPGNRRVIFVVDGLDQLDETDNAHSLNWVPWKLPANIKVIASCNDDPDRGEAVLEAFRQRDHKELKIEPLTDAERIEIVNQVPSLSARTLDPEQVGLLLQNPATTNPLFLLVSLEELRGFGSFEELNDRIKSFPQEGETITSLFRQVIERLEAESGRELVRSVFTLLASARHGLSESELQTLIGADEQSENLFLILRQARPNLQSRGELIGFFHRDFFKAVREMYLSSEEQQVTPHRRLARYFHNILNRPGTEPWSGDHPRAFSELPYHQTQSRHGKAPGTLEGHTDTISAVVVTLDGKKAVTGSYDKSLRIWNVGSGKCLDTLEGHTDIVLDVVLTPDGNKVISASEDKTLRVWDVNSGKCIFTLVGHSSGVHTVAVTPDGTRAVSASGNAFGNIHDADSDKPIRVWDVNSGECLRTFEGHTDTVLDVVLSPDGELVVSATGDRIFRCEDNNIGIWHVLSGVCIDSLEGHLSAVTSVTFTPDGSKVVSCSDDERVRVWDFETDECHTLEGYTSAALTADGRRAVSASRDNRIYVWDVNTGECLNVIEGHAYAVSLMALTEDGNTAVFQGRDNSLSVWDLAIGKMIAVYPLESDCRSVAVTLENRIIAGTESGQVHFLTLCNWAGQ